MRGLMVLICLVAAVFAADAQGSKYDDFDLDGMIADDELFQSYILCFLGRGGCTPEGTVFKDALPQIISSTCGRCTDKQKNNVRKLCKAIQTKYPNYWNELMAKNDPTGTHRQSFNRFIQGN